MDAEASEHEFWGLVPRRKVTKKDKPPFSSGPACLGLKSIESKSLRIMVISF